MCNGASSRGSLLWYRPTSEKWHATVFRKPDMTAGYLVSLLHRCTTALGKKRHQSYSSARRQRRIISRKVFTASLKKLGTYAKKKWIMGTAQKSLSVKKIHLQAYQWCLQSRALAGAVLGNQEHHNPWTKRPGHPKCPSTRGGNQHCWAISLSFLSSPVK